MSKTITRYFIVYYQASLSSGYVTGYCDITCTGTFPFLNRKKVTDYLLESDKTFVSVVLTGFNELTKSDYEQWISVPEPN